MILFLFLFLFSCRPQPDWVLEKTVTCHSSYNSGVLFYPTEDCFNGLELEVAKTQSGLSLYINTFYSPISDNSSNNQVDVLIKVDSEEYHFLSDLLKGGQRLRLPQEAQDLIISSLLNGMTLDIYVDRYHQTISPTYFPVPFSQLERL